MFIFLILLISLFTASKGIGFVCTENNTLLTREGNTAILWANTTYIKADNESRRVSILFINTSGKRQILTHTNDSTGGKNDTISLTLKNVSQPDSGTYIMSDGAKSFCWNLFVLGIESTNQGTLIKNGLSAVFKGYPEASLLEAKGFDATLKWLVQDRDVYHSTKFTVLRDIMTIPVVSPEMDGWVVTYRSTHSSGRVTEVNQTLTVVYIESKTEMLMQEGSSATIKGHPSANVLETRGHVATVSWLLNGRNPFETTNSSITVEENIMKILVVTREMDGWNITYRCLEDSGSVTEATKTLSVIYIESMTEMLMQEGSSATIKGHPSANVLETRGHVAIVSWLLNGRNPFKTTKSFITVEENTLKIPLVTREMDGWNITYRCLEDSGSVTEATKTLSVIWQSFAVNFEDIESKTEILMQEGSYVTMKGHPSANVLETRGLVANVSWLLNGRNPFKTTKSSFIVEENTLKIPHVTREMDGWNITYRCLEDSGSVSETTNTLSVIYIESKTEMLMQEGSSATVKGHPSVNVLETRKLVATVSWLLNGRNPFKTTKSSFIVEENTLKIPHVTREMDGWNITYRCLEDSGNVTEATKTLSVIYIESLQESKIIAEGAVVKFRGNPKVSYFGYSSVEWRGTEVRVTSMWLFDAQHIYKTWGVNVQGDTLHIQRVTRDMDGKNVTYRCTTLSGYMAEVNTTLRIMYLMSSRVNTFIEEGSSVLYRIYPPARALQDLNVNSSFMWLFDGDKINQLNQIMQFLEREEMLLIPHVSRAMEDKILTFRFIEDSGYETELSTRLRVSYGPIWPIRLNPTKRKYHVQIGDELPDVTCNAICLPLCEMSWGEHSKSRTLHVGQVTMETEGVYTCTARGMRSNAAISTSIYVYVQDKASIAVPVAVLTTFQVLTGLVVVALVIWNCILIRTKGRFHRRFFRSLRYCIESHTEAKEVRTDNLNCNSDRDIKMSNFSTSSVTYAAYEDLRPDDRHGPQSKYKKRKADYVNTHPTWNA